MGLTDLLAHLVDLHLPTLVQLTQVVAGLAWSFLAVLFAGAVLRVWFGGADIVDVLVSPLAFVALDQVGFSVRWLIFPGAMRVMGTDELILWAGLYTLSVLAVVWLTLAYRAARVLLRVYLEYAGLRE